MGEPLGKMFSALTFIFFVIFLFLMLTLTFEEKMVYNKVDNMVYEYAHQLQTSGYIDGKDYEHFVVTLQGYGRRFRVELTHSQLVIEPDPKKEGNFIRTYQKIGSDAIRRKMYASDNQSHRYKMRKGDKINVTIDDKGYGNTPWKSFKAYMFHSINPISITTSHGGEVQNEV